jgi:hypothetical protein
MGCMGYEGYIRMNNRYNRHNIRLPSRVLWDVSDNNCEYAVSPSRCLSAKVLIDPLIMGR